MTLVVLIWVGPSHATVGKPMIVYSEDETASIQSSQFNSSTNSWATPTTVATTSNKQGWKAVATNANGNKKAVVSVEVPPSGNPYIYAAIYDESNWDDGNGSAYNDLKQLGQVSDATYRRFFAAYEQVSGKLLVVADDYSTAGQINYWTYDGSTWSSANTYAFSTITGHPRFIRMASKPGANEIAFIVSDSNGYTTVMIWDGSTWGNEYRITTGNLSAGTECIGIDYIRAGAQQGYIFAATAESGSGVTGTVWNGSTWTESYLSGGSST